LILKPSKNDSRHPVFAMFRPDIPNNYIAERIVRRLSLVVYRSSSFTAEAGSDQLRLPPTNDCVSLACYPEEEKDDFAIYRFYVVKHRQFDLLFGAGSVRSG